MKYLVALMVLIIIMPAVSAYTEVNVSITGNDVVREDFYVSFHSYESYEFFEFYSHVLPLSVVYGGDYSVKKEGDNYIIMFLAEIQEGKNELSFSVLYDEIIERSGAGKVFRADFSGQQPLHVRMSLPEGHFLMGDPAVYPSPERISTDGKRITLEWTFEERASVVVFYGTDRISYTWIFILIIVILVCLVFFMLFFAKKSRKKIEDILSEDEKLILNQIRRGNAKQKDISKNLGFSKSKMSKVVRKLEEKNLVERIPHFKTNILKIKK